MRILIVEDEKKMAGFIERGLKENKFSVDVAHNGQDGMDLMEMNPYDLLILDVMLPDTDGITLCKKIRNKRLSVPILLLTARNSVQDKVTGLNSGADDYLPKPFDFQELLARIHALLRRTQTEKSGVLSLADLELNPLNQRVTRAGKEIILTAKEYSLLRYLMQHAYQVVTRTMITQHVWNEDFDRSTNVIDVYINYLRNKIDKGFDKPLVHAVRSTGYILSDEIS